MEQIFFEIVFIVPDLLASGFDSREDVEENLERALTQSKIGEVSGGGSGMGKAVIDVDISSGVSKSDAIAFLREVLQGLGVPRSTQIKRHRPQLEIFEVYP